ncbi:PLP-dependent aminotransferase family protein [Micromonospora sonneratiae]|uniref:PLP-dependent aminotransferase family protein n=1 Tax=Micromonospora sonneratiae TaxID=1184706 RepID=A0ABW3Y9K7_9ACTN
MERPAPIIQFEERPGILDLGWGHPLPSLLPVEQWSAASQAAARTFGWRALTYGYAAGPGPLIEWLAEHLSRTERVRVRTSQFFVTGGASHALALVSTILTDPGDVVLVDSPTYHFALRILRDRGVQLVPAPVDSAGIDPAALDDLMTSLRSQGRRIPLLYLVATYGNPTGRSLPDRRRHELVQLAQRSGLTIVEDDTYRELSYEPVAPQSLWSIADGRAVVRIGSFSKTVAPGLRLGWLNAAPEIVRTLTGLGYVDSGGGVNHHAALTMATFGASGAYHRHVAEVRGHYLRSRDVLVDTLRAALPDFDVPSPAGGWFVWLPLDQGVRASTLRPAAEQLGVSFVEGGRFYATGQQGDDHLRLAFSFLTPEQLVEAAGRLAHAVRTVLG